MKKYVIVGLCSLILLTIGVILSLQYVKKSNEIYITGLTPLTYELGNEKPDLNENVKSLNGHQKPILIPYIIDESAVKWNTVGNYTLLYTYKNLTYPRQLTIRGDKPFFSLVDELVFPITKETIDYVSYLKAYDLFGNEISERIEANSNQINPRLPGQYPLLVSVSDDYGLSTSQTLMVEYYHDETTNYHPVITQLNAFEYMIGNETTPYKENLFGIDYFGKDMTDSIVIDDKFVNYNQTGFYPVLLSLKDDYGFETKITTEIEVKWSTENTIHFEGLKDFVIKLGDQKPDYLENINALDSIEGDLSNQILVDESNINYTLIGEYMLFYRVTNSLGFTQNAMVQVRIITDEYDSEPPVFTGIQNLTYYMSQTKPDLHLGILAYDEVSGNLTNRILVSDEEVKWEIPGTYTVYYEVMDDTLNKTIETRKVTVIDDVPPVFYGIVDIYVSLESGTYPDLIQHVTAYDNVDMDITASIEVDDSLVDISQKGTYKIIYTITDLRNNITTQISYVIVY
ncbi:DUF5011 domain-containing protein [Acholeplasma vituli]|uniref:DUF5011 domain-containing protein n=1 Tax=Paracholeplasma vituli TaxID=69473 RepID=A0ABT2PWE2_9MOLU|nr:DUF5011 domain-containing protein [Paracholeplasma vituli]MCU0104629.1 DUF5011 domain-containing protein [Paracholeplasma vituli]